MRVNAVIALLLAACLSGCVTFEPAAQAAGVGRGAGFAGLPLVDGTAAAALIAASKVPVVLLFTAKDCEDCAAAQAELRRALRRSNGRVTGALLDAERSPDFWRRHGKPALPAAMLFESGQARWLVFGSDGMLGMSGVLTANEGSFVHGLKALPSDGRKPRARVFLVAANADSAAFAQEVVDQTAYWKSQGLTGDEIACYWSVPAFGHYWADKEQFTRLAPALQGCHRADLAAVERDWRTAAAAQPAWMYLYVSSHGIGDKQAVAAARRIAKALRKEPKMALDANACAAMGRAQLIFDALPDTHEAAPFDDIFVKACQGFFAPLPSLTAARLRDLLAAAPLASKKTVVLQGCHSGGVVPNMMPAGTIILAAARPDRSSFGCNADGERTVYGESLLTVLNRLKPRPEHPDDWIKVHDAVAAQVKAKETTLKIPRGERSEPMIFARP